MVDKLVDSIDEFGFVRLANGARVFCDPGYGTYYSSQSNPLPIKSWIESERPVIGLSRPHASKPIDRRYSRRIENEDSEW